MTMDAVFRKIDRYLKKENVEPLVIDVQNSEDLDEIVTHYNLPQNKMVCASNFCKQDEFPLMDTLMNFLGREEKTCFVREVSSFFRMKGELELKQALSELLSMNCEGHVVILTYQCKLFLRTLIQNDRRLENRICIIDGEPIKLPQLIFTVKGANFEETEVVVEGINNIAKAVEDGATGVLYVETKKRNHNFPLSLYSIKELIDAYDILCDMDILTQRLSRSVGKVEDWNYVLSEFRTYPSWERLISEKIGNVHDLANSIPNSRNTIRDRRWQWLYFVSLKLFGISNDKYLCAVIKKTDIFDDFCRNLFRTILDFDYKDKEYWSIYERRKTLLQWIDNSMDEVTNYCKFVLSKEAKAIYYLTDSSSQEQETIFKLLDKYGLVYSKNELMEILEKVYPSLHEYLMPYNLKNDLLNQYFQEYKYQKVINKIFPEFMNIVEEQAVKRDYNVILQPRSSVIESIDTNNAQTYFTDAMGIEYLGYIMAKCEKLHLMAKVTICRSELPSITSRNKEFWDILSSEKYPIITFDKIDKMKHHGEGGYDYSRADGKLPIHLIKELALIDELLNKIKQNLVNGTYSKAILISDHGASRLAVIHEAENLCKMESNGQHSGRCCPKSEVDIKPDNATDADDFWVLANYDRFKGSRRANVEVHGGATLEEVAVPIVELTYLNSKVDVKIMPIDDTASFTEIPEILVSFRKKAAIKIFITQKLQDVSIQIDGHSYEAKEIDDNFYVVENMPEIRRAQTYRVDVFACGNKIASSLPLRVKKESGSEKSIL